MRQSLAQGCADSGVDCKFHNPLTARFISETEAAFVLRRMDRRLPTGQPVWWDFSEVRDDFTGPNSDLAQLRAMLGGLDDIIDDDEGDESGKGETEEDVVAMHRHLTEEEKLIAVQEYLRRVGEVTEAILSRGYETLVV